MTGQFDVAGRLAEGRPAVDTVDIYVSACAALGFDHPDLTAHTGQVDGWYSTETGMDLQALDGDCARLRAAVTATEQARDLQDGQAGALAESWAGFGGQSAQEFLRRHGDASAVAAAAVRTAAELLAELRDSLWRSVDAKVVETQAIGDRAESAEWRAAAHTVLTGAGDRVTASELVDLRVKPFVADEVGTGWVGAMRAGAEDVAAAYDAATAELSAGPAPAFAVPADWGAAPVPTVSAGVVETVSARMPPVGEPSGGGPPAWGGSPAWSAPAAGAMPWAASSPIPAAMEPAAAVPETPAPSVEPAAVAPAPSSTPAMGGLPDVGSGLSGMGQQFADMLGGLLGSSGDALSGLDEPEPPDIDDVEHHDGETAADDPEQDDVEPDSGAGSVNPAGGGGSPAPTDAAGSTPDAIGPTPECAEGSTPSGPVEEPRAEEEPAGETPAEPPPTPPPPAEPVAAAEPPPQDAPVEQASTPCEIAADDVPQAGE
jgi:hypothetical protein